MQLFDAMRHTQLFFLIGKNEQVVFPDILTVISKLLAFLSLASATTHLPANSVDSPVTRVSVITSWFMVFDL